MAAGSAPAVAEAWQVRVNFGEQSDPTLAEALVTEPFGGTPSEQWLRAVLAAVPLPAAITDEALCVLAANSAFGALLERPHEALIGSCAGRLLGLDDLPHALVHGHPPLETAPDRVTTARPRHLDGSNVEWTVTMTRLEVSVDQPLHLLTLAEPDKASHERAPWRESPTAAPPIHTRTLFDPFGKSLPIIALEPDGETNAGTLPLIERATTIIRRDQRAGAERTYILPIPFALFEDPDVAAACLASCRALPESVRQCLILLLDELPAALAPERLAATLEALRPFARTLALALGSLDAAPAALEALPIGLVALAAERLADGYLADPDRLRERCERLRAAGIALLSRNCATQADAEFARRLRVDFICHSADPRSLPRSRLFALSGVRGNTEHLPTLPHTAIIEATDSGILYVDATDPYQPIVRVNPAFLALTGYAEHEVLGRNCRFLQGPDTDPATVAQIRSQLREGKPVRCEILNYRKDGSSFWNQLLISPVRDANGRVIAFAGIQTDVTDRHTAQAAHQHYQQVLEGISDSMPGFAYQLTQRTDGRREFTYLGRAAAALLGLEEDVPLTPNGFFALAVPADRPRLEQSWAHANASLTTLDLEFAIQRPDGERLWLRTRARPVRQDSGNILWNGVMLDVTPEKTAKDELNYLRDHDPLTRLPNAKKFHSELADHMRKARSIGRRAALYMVDFVRFHEINDTFGMSKGDQILTLIAARLHEAFPAGSRFYRLQADQFAVLGNAVLCEENARQIAATAAPILCAPFCLPGGPINLPARIGLCVDSCETVQAATCEAALEFAQRADIALHAAKRAARPGISLYSSDIDDRLRTSVIVKQSLRGAIERHEFELHYQPIVQLSSGRILGAEALVRWNHPLLGMQTPDSFIPIAEESGLIGPLGAWILRDALRAAGLCRDAQLPLPRVAVNVSGVQISDPAFLRTVEEALAESGVDPRMLELELTETFLIEHSSESAHALSALRKLGVRIAIDDFGAGYSSFRYLRDLPLDKLKVDRGFIRHLQPKADADVSILKAMVAMAHSLGVELVIEGVETPYQRDVLADIGCEIAQGYFFCRPQPLSELMRLLEERSGPEAIAHGR